MIEADPKKDSMQRSLSVTWEGFGVANHQLYLALNPDPDRIVLNPEGTDIFGARMRVQTATEAFVRALTNSSQEIVDSVIPQDQKQSLFVYFQGQLPEDVLGKIKPVEPAAR